VRALSLIYRGKFRDGMKALGLYDAVPEKVWKKDWVVHCEPVGKGPEAIRYQPVGTKDWKLMTLPAVVFMARFLQHVLPKGLCKVRYYGYLH